MNCDLCGTEVKVVGHTTQHYEPVDKIEELKKANSAANKIIGEQADETDKIVEGLKAKVKEQQDSIQWVTSWNAREELLSLEAKLAKACDALRPFAEKFNTCDAKFKLDDKVRHYLLSDKQTILDYQELFKAKQVLAEIEEK